MKLLFLLSLSTGFAFLRYTLSIPSFLNPDSNFTCNNLLQKVYFYFVYYHKITSMQTIVWGYDIAVNGQTDITRGPGAIQVFSFIMVFLLLCGIVKLSTPR